MTDIRERLLDALNQLVHDDTNPARVNAVLAELPLTQVQLDGLASGEMVVVPKLVLDAAVKRANYDYQEGYVQADPNHFHMQRREAIFELRKHTDPYNSSMGFAAAQEEQP